mmetsp:Transcript_17364/g.31629  ORF Transcript_17364/g.31629 Transcript_17364/m.31629 type:complete len:320 (+) Transcript_17364:149-1108(+)
MRRRAPSEARALPTHALRLVRPDVFDGLLQRDSDRSVSHPQLGLGLRSGEEEVATDGSAHEISRRGGGGAAYAATPPARHNPRAEGQPCRDLEPRARRSRDLGDEVVIFRCDQPLIADQVPLANVIRLPCRSDDGRRGVAHVHIGKNGLARDGGGDFAIDQILDSHHVTFRVKELRITAQAACEIDHAAVDLPAMHRRQREAIALRFGARIHTQAWPWLVLLLERGLRRQASSRGPSICENGRHLHQFDAPPCLGRRLLHCADQVRDHMYVVELIGGRVWCPPRVERREMDDGSAFCQIHRPRHVRRIGQVALHAANGL